MSDILDIEYARGIMAAEIELVAAAVHAATMPVDPADISRPSLRLIFEAAIDLDRRGQIISAVEIVALLRSWDTLRGLTLDGGLDLIVALVEYRPTYSRLEYHAEIVRAVARRRRQVLAAIEVIADARADGSVDEVIAQLQRGAA